MTFMFIVAIYDLDYIILKYVIFILILFYRNISTTTKATGNIAFNNRVEIFFISLSLILVILFLLLFF